MASVNLEHARTWQHYFGSSPFRVQDVVFRTFSTAARADHQSQGYFIEPRKCLLHYTLLCTVRQPYIRTLHLGNDFTLSGHRQYRYHCRNLLDDGQLGLSSSRTPSSAQA